MRRGWCVPLTRKIAKSWKCGWGNRLLLVEAILWLAIARAAVLLVPFRWIERALRLVPGPVPVANDQLAAEEGAVRVGWAGGASAANAPWESTCLVQALAGTAMLRRRGIAGALALGVARSAWETRGFMAHAWLSCGRSVITGAGGREAYQLLA